VGRVWVCKGAQVNGFVKWVHESHHGAEPGIRLSHTGQHPKNPLNSVT
jgi:hypothetical protein